jgi:hypothetical protein
MCKHIDCEQCQKIKKRSKELFDTIERQMKDPKKIRAVERKRMVRKIVLP